MARNQETSSQSREQVGSEVVRSGGGIAAGHPLTRLLVAQKEIFRTAQELQGRGYRLMWIDNYSFVVSAIPANFDLADFDLIAGEEEDSTVGNMQ